jgi:2-polyprenyl-6-methoxyphenol hydroxylase-like FAD-dependent oxidoreductase
MQPDIDNAIVIGGGMAGLMAARMLSFRFRRVTVIDRDQLPEEAVNRPGAPQGHHVHVLLSQGRRILNGLFPGFEEELYRNGAMAFDSGADFQWLTPAGWAPRFQTGLTLFAASRPLIEWVARRRVTAQANVRFLEASSVTGLVRSPEGQVAGVSLRCAAGSEETLSAGLVVDTSGRSSHVPEWLEAMGRRRPAETRVDGRLAYASRTYRRDGRMDWQACFSQAAPPANCRTGLAFPIEGNRWIVTLAGGGGDHPPAGEEGFRAFARSLPNPGVAAVVDSAEPLTPIVTHRGTVNRWRHYERLSMPAGMAVLGDSFCAFNPVYGQGMSTAAMGVELLAECLDRGQMPGFHRALAKKLETAWMFATGEDLRYPGAVGGSVGMGLKIMHAYTDRVIAASTQDHDVRLNLLRVMHLLEGPGVLFSPRIAWKALRGPSPDSRPGTGHATRLAS